MSQWGSRSSTHPVSSRRPWGCNLTTLYATFGFLGLFLILEAPVPVEARGSVTVNAWTIRTISRSFSAAQGITLGTNVDIYVADTTANVIRKTNHWGSYTTTIAGSTQGNVQAQGTSAKFDRPGMIAYSPLIKWWFVSQRDSHVIRWIDTNLNVDILIGTYNSAGNAAKKLNGPTGVVVPWNQPGMLYWAEAFACIIRSMDITSTSSPAVRVSGTYGSCAFFDGGDKTTALFNGPQQIAGMLTGDILVADTLNFRLRQVRVSDGMTKTYACTGTSTYLDGPRLTAGCHYPYGLAVSPYSGMIIFTEYQRHTIRKIVSDTVSTIAGTVGTSGDKDGWVLKALLNNPWQIGFSWSDLAFYVTQNNARMYKVSQPTPTETPTITVATTLSLSLTSTRVPTPPPTPTNSLTDSQTMSFSASEEISATKSYGSFTLSPSVTMSLSGTLSLSRTATQIPTPSPSEELSLTRTVTGPPTGSTTPTFSYSVTRTKTPPPTASSSPSFSFSSTSSMTPPPTASTSPTMSFSFTPSQTPPPTATRTLTITPPLTPTGSKSVSGSGTRTDELTATRSVTFSTTETASLSTSSTMSSSTTITLSQTATPPPTGTISITLSSSMTLSLSAQTLSATPSMTLSSTRGTASASDSFTPSQTDDLTASRTLTLTPVPTPSTSPTVSLTSTVTDTLSGSVTISPSPSITPPKTVSLSTSLTSSQSFTEELSASVTTSASQSWTLSSSASSSQSLSQSMTGTVTKTPPPTPSLTRTLTSTRSAGTATISSTWTLTSSVTLPASTSSSLTSTLSMTQGSPSLSSSVSLTLTSTVTPPPTPSSTPTWTSTLSAGTATMSSTWTVTSSMTLSASTSSSLTNTLSMTQGSPSLSPSVSLTLSRTVTPPPTPTSTLALTLSDSYPTLSGSGTWTVSDEPTGTSTISTTMSMTAGSITMSRSHGTLSPTFSLSGKSPSTTTSATASITLPRTRTRSLSRSLSSSFPSPSVTLTDEISLSASISTTMTSTVSRTTTPPLTPSKSVTLTPPPTETATISVTGTVSNTLTVTSTLTPPPTPTSSASMSWTESPSSTKTFSVTPPPTGTESRSITVSVSSSTTETMSWSLSLPPTESFSMSRSLSKLSLTLSTSSTSTLSSSVTFTSSATPPPTPTSSKSVTLTPSPTYVFRNITPTSSRSEEISESFSEATPTYSLSETYLERLQTISLPASEEDPVGNPAVALSGDRAVREAAAGLEEPSWLIVIAACCALFFLSIVVIFFIVVQVRHRERARRRLQPLDSTLEAGDAGDHEKAPPSLQSVSVDDSGRNVKQEEDLPFDDLDIMAPDHQGEGLVVVFSQNADIIGPAIEQPTVKFGENSTAFSTMHFQGLQKNDPDSDDDLSLELEWEEGSASNAEPLYTTGAVGVDWVHQNPTQGTDSQKEVVKEFGQECSTTGSSENSLPGSGASLVKETPSQSEYLARQGENLEPGSTATSLSASRDVAASRNPFPLELEAPMALPSEETKEISRQDLDELAAAVVKAGPLPRPPSLPPAQSFSSKSPSTCPASIITPAAGMRLMPMSLPTVFRPDSAESRSMMIPLVSPNEEPLGFDSTLVPLQPATGGPMIEGMQSEPQKSVAKEDGSEDELYFDLDLFTTMSHAKMEPWRKRVPSSSKSLSTDRRSHNDEAKDHGSMTSLVPPDDEPAAFDSTFEPARPSSGAPLHSMQSEARKAVAEEEDGSEDELYFDFGLFTPTSAADIEPWLKRVPSSSKSISLSTVDLRGRNEATRDQLPLGGIEDFDAVWCRSMYASSSDCDSRRGLRSVRSESHEGESARSSSTGFLESVCRVDSVLLTDEKTESSRTNRPSQTPKLESTSSLPTPGLPEADVSPSHLPMIELDELGSVGEDDFSTLAQFHTTHGSVIKMVPILQSRAVRVDTLDTDGCGLELDLESAHSSSTSSTSDESVKEREFADSKPPGDEPFFIAGYTSGTPPDGGFRREDDALEGLALDVASRPTSKRSSRPSSKSSTQRNPRRAGHPERDAIQNDQIDENAMSFTMSMNVATQSLRLLDEASKKQRRKPSRSRARDSLVFQEDAGTSPHGTNAALPQHPLPAETVKPDSPGKATVRAESITGPHSSKSGHQAYPGTPPSTRNARIRPSTTSGVQKKRPPKRFEHGRRENSVCPAELEESMRGLKDLPAVPSLPTLARSASHVPKRRTSPAGDFHFSISSRSSSSFSGISASELNHDSPQRKEQRLARTLSSNFVPKKNADTLDEPDSQRRRNEDTEEMQWATANPPMATVAHPSLPETVTNSKFVGPSKESSDSQKPPQNQQDTATAEFEEVDFEWSFRPRPPVSFGAARWGSSRTNLKQASENTNPRLK